MQLPKSFVLFFLLTLLFAAAVPSHADDSAPVNISVGKWKYNRIWKSAAKQKTHFFECTLTVRNTAVAIQNMAFTISLKNANGEVLTQSPKVRIGYMGVSGKKTKKFDIDHAFEFSEARIVLEYKREGKKLTETFVAGWEQPFQREMDNSAGDASRPEIRTISHDIMPADMVKTLSEQKKKRKSKLKRIGKKKKKKRKKRGVKSQEAFLSVRLKNLYNQPASNLEAVIVFTYDDKTKSDEIVVKIADEIRAGATQSFKLISVGVQKPFMKYSMGIRAQFSEQPGDNFSYGKGALMIGELAFETPALDASKKHINMQVVNKADRHSNESLRVTLVLKGESGNTIKEIDAVIRRGLAPGAKTTMKFPVAKPLKWFSYELSTITVK